MLAEKQAAEQAQRRAEVDRQAAETARRDAQIAADRARAEPPARTAEAETRRADADARPAAAAVDGLYAGPICYGPAGREQRRCYQARGIIADGKISGRWRGRDPGVTLTLSGLVSASGGVQIEIRIGTAEQPRTDTINLMGSLREGRLDAIGSFANGRSANLVWQRQ